MRKTGRLSEVQLLAEAETTAAEALRYLAEDQRRIAAFLSESGLQPATLVAAVGSRDTLAAILDHVTRDESLLLAFTADTGRRPEDVMAAMQLLSGPLPEASP